MKPILVTSYARPDLDGFGGAWAYTELLNHQGKNAMARFFEPPRGEERYVMELFAGSYPEPIANDDQFGQVVLVDASDIVGGLIGRLHPEKVTEVIDHRLYNDESTFPNAQYQVEPVGAAATLVAERFHHAQLTPTPLSAALLLGGIISNTQNFQANVTTQRDHAMADWLRSQLNLPADFVTHLFEKKSDLMGAKLHERFLGESALFELRIGSEPTSQVNQVIDTSKVGPVLRIMISQIEMIGAAELVVSREADILNELHGQAKLKYADRYFLSLLDVGGDYNLFITDDPASQQLVETTRNVKFTGMVARREGVIMRKEIVPKLQRQLEAR